MMPIYFVPVPATIAPILKTPATYGIIGIVRTVAACISFADAL
jgi:hypothetical protein